MIRWTLINMQLMEIENEEEKHTHVPTDPTKPTFNIVCAGCHRTFLSQSNFTKHFFCPYRLKDPAKNPIKHSLPVIYMYLGEKFYYPQHVAKLLEMLFEEMDSYIYEDAIMELNKTMTLDMKRHLVLFLPDFIAKHVQLF